MGVLNVTRRRFVALSAATAAAVTMSGTLLQGTALAEDTVPPVAGKTGVTKVRTCCRGCGKM